MADDERLIGIASAVAEGSAVDWEAAEQTTKDGSERAVVRQLRVLARIADVVRVPDTTGRVKWTDGQDGDELGSRYLPRLRRWARGRLPAHSGGVLATDDLAEDVLGRATVAPETIGPRHEGAFQGFLRQIMVNRVRDEVRKARRRPTYELIDDARFAEDPSPIELAVGREAFARYEAALGRLKSHERQLIVARCELDFSNDEIAVLFNKPSSAAVRVAVGRALVRLAQEMAHG